MSGTKEYFRIPCEMQIRLRSINAEELKMFSSFSMRPSPYSSLKTELEHTIQSLDVRQESKTLFEKAFQLLLNIDQRLERIEESILNLSQGQKAPLEHYEWVNGDLGAQGLVFAPTERMRLQKGAEVLVDMVLPSLPEYRLVAACKVGEEDAEGRRHLVFEAIHDDDREFIHRYVMSRERELLRARALDRDRPKS